MNKEYRINIDIERKNSILVVLISASLLGVLFSTALANIFLLLLSAFWVLFVRQYIIHSTRRDRFYTMLFCSYYMLGMVNIINSDSLAGAHQWLDGKLPLFGLPIIVLLSPLGKSNIRSICDVFSFGLVLISFFLFGFGLWRYLESGSADMLIYIGLLEPLELHPTYVSLFSAFGVFHLYDRRNEPDAVGRNKRLVYAAIGILFVFNILVLSRAGTLALFLIIGLFGLYRLIQGRASWKFWVSLLSIIVIFYFLWPLVELRFSFLLTTDLLDDNKMESVALHAKSWYCAVQLLSDYHFLTGYGTSDEKAVLVECYAAHGWELMVAQKLNAHNEYLSASLRHGVIGGIVTVMMILVPAVFAIRTKEYLYAAFLVFVGIIFLSGSLNGYHGIVFYATINALLCKKTLIKANERTALAN